MTADKSQQAAAQASYHRHACNAITSPLPSHISCRIHVVLNVTHHYNTGEVTACGLRS